MGKLAWGQVVLPGVVYFLLCSLASPVWAEAFREGFEAETTTSWQFVRGVSRAQSVKHERTTKIVRSGEQSEAFLLETFANDGCAGLIHKLPPALRFDELKASV